MKKVPLKIIARISLGIIFGLFLLLACGCKMLRKVDKSESNKELKEQIITQTVRKGDTVTYVVPRIIPKDTTIYTYNRVGTRLETRFDSSGNLAHAECIESLLNELKIENRELREESKEKATESEKETKGINLNLIIGIIAGFIFLYADKKF